MATIKKKKQAEIPADCMPMCSTCVYGEVKDDAICCRRFPPVFISDEGEGGFAFPIMVADDWCGEYIRRING